MIDQQQILSFRDILLKKLPSQYITAQARDHFARLADLLDGVGRRDQRSQEVYIDEQSFRQLLQAFLPGSEDKALAMLQGIAGNKLVSTSGAGSPGTLQAIDWATLVATIHPDRSVPVPDSTLGSSPTVDDIRQAAQRLVPQLPDDLFDDPKILRQYLVTAFNPPRTEQEALQPALYDPWGCMVNHLGFWGAVAAVVFVAACILALDIVLAAGGPLTWAAFWAVFIAIAPYYGIFYAILVIFSCLRGLTPPF